MMKDLKQNYSVTKSRLKLLMVIFFSKKQQDRNLLIYLMEELEIIFARKMIAWQKFLEKKSAIIILGQRWGSRGIAESAKVSSYANVSTIKSNQTVIGGKNSQA